MGMKNKLLGFAVTIAAIFFFFFIILTITPPRPADTTSPRMYYVDNLSGSDSHSGTSTDQAWKTIAKVNGSQFHPGDWILFKRGGIWREKLIIPSSGVRDNLILFGAYGTGAKPIITGADLVTGWTQYSGNIYVADVGFLTPPTQLYVDDVYYDIARYPADGFILATSDAKNAHSIVAADLPLSPEQIIGATVIAKPVPWLFDSSKAADYDPSSHTITLDGVVDKQSPDQVMRTGYGFYLENKLWMLDTEKEWYYDSSSGKIYLWMTDNPNKHTVEVSIRDTGVYAVKNYLIIRNLAITKANGTDILMDYSTGITLRDLDLQGGFQGIWLAGATDCSITNNSIQSTLTSGIIVNADGPTKSNNVLISKNVLNNCGYVGLSPRPGEYVGISGAGSNINIADNTLTNIGNNGIGFGNGSHNTIQNNTLTNTCLVEDDAGAIHLAGHSSEDVDNRVIGNIITNAIGNNSGTPSDPGGKGIYLDGYIMNVTVQDNKISNVTYGIMSEASGNKIIGNVVRGATFIAVYIDQQKNAPETIQNQVITNNIFECTSKETSPAIYPDVAYPFGESDYNIYYHPNYAYPIRTWGANTTKKEFYSLDAWRTASGQDAHSLAVKTGYPTPIVTPPTSPSSTTSTSR